MSSKFRQPKNLICLPSIVCALILTVFSHFEPVKDHYLLTGEVAKSLVVNAFWGLIQNSVVLIAARYADGDDDIYTPKILPGRNKSDILMEQTQPNFINDDQ